MGVAATPLLTQVAAARAVLAETLVLKMGQVLEALVLGTTADGVTALKLGDLVLTAKLPQPLPAGTVLQVQVKTGGATPELAVMKQALPTLSRPVLPVAPQTAPRAAALHLTSIVPELEVEGGGTVTTSAVPGARSTLVPANPDRGHEIVAGVSIGPTVRPIVPPGQAGPPLSTVARPFVAPSSVNGGGDEMTQHAASQQGPVGAPAATNEQGGGQHPAVPTPQPGVPAAGRIVSLADLLPPAAATAGDTAARERTIAAPAGPPTSPSAHSELAQQAGSRGPASASLPTAQAASADARTAPSPATPAPAVADEGHPLLVAQEMTRAVATAADLPRAPFSVPQPSPTSLPSSLGPQQPATPAAAVAQAVPQALARQDSLRPLLISLAVAVSRPGLLPEPAVRIARQVLAQRVVVEEGRVAPDDVARAIDRSGVLLEARLARGVAEPLDLKSLLLALRERLAPARPTGPEPNPPAVPDGPPHTAPQPPLRGLPLRAAPSDPPQMPDAGKDALRLLHDQTDAAVSRIKLAQVASLPDRTDPARPAAPMLRLEIPFLYGHELVMAQIAVGRDGGRRGSDRKRGWMLKFALNSAATGEVGADVGLMGKAVNVALWAAEAETAEAFSTHLPELKRGLEAAGLSPASVRVRRGVPEPEPRPSGGLVDSVS